MRTLAHQTITAFQRTVGVTLAALVFAVASAHAQTVGTVVRFVTSAGPIDMGLYDADAPRTVANFLTYVRSGAYEGSFFHRLVPSFVLQGGGFRVNDAATPKLNAIPPNAPVANEFSPTRSNVRGTVAMAKLSTNPDSATNQWFVNLGNNSANLDAQNGGFSVFGRVLDATLPTVDALAKLPVGRATGCTNLGAVAAALTDTPFYTAIQSCAEVNASTLVAATRVVELKRSTASVADRVFNYLEAAFPQYTKPASSETLNAAGWTFRYYASSGNYTGVRDGQLYALVPAIQPDVIPLGPVDGWLAQATAAGY